MATVLPNPFHGRRCLDPMRSVRVTLLLACLGISSLLRAQDYSWWNEANNWDGVTHWSDYLNFSPYYMGPDALPVPLAMSGYFEPETRVELGAGAHFSEGDDTQDLRTALHVPFAGGRVAMQLDWMALEHYRMDTVTRDERHARDRDGTGTSTGDVYINTLVQVLPERADRVGLLLRVRLKTASGGNLEAARHTDAPGYSFDLSVGHWRPAHKAWLERWRPFAMLGFLVYQTNRTDYYQNDCLLFGGGLLADHGRWRSEVSVAGYMGYLDQDDRPIVFRASLETDRDARIDHRFGLQGPLKDWRYMTVGYTVCCRLGSAIGAD